MGGRLGEGTSQRNTAATTKSTMKEDRDASFWRINHGLAREISARIRAFFFAVCFPIDVLLPFYNSRSMISATERTTPFGALALIPSAAHSIVYP